MKYKLNEIFYSLQGEGYHTGSPAVFIRFSTCNLKCSFCDTDFSEKLSLTKEQIYEKIKYYKSKFIIFTGGEPTLQLDKELILYLKDKGYYIAIETNGTNRVDSNVDWITVSPKSKINQKIGDELKVVWSIFNKFDYSYLKFDNYYIQPESEKNIKEIITYIKENPKWKLSLQTHKLLKIQ